MPQPRKSSSTARSSGSTAGGRNRARARTRATDETAQASADGLRDQLQRLLAPLDAVLVSRERLQEAVDDAVKRGRMTHSDATELVSDIVSRSRRTTEDLLSDVDQLLGGPADRVRREVDRARRATGLGAAFPIAGYEQLTAAQVQGRLDDLSPAELRKVRDYERRNANRKTVLAAVESKLA